MNKDTLKRIGKIAVKSLFTLVIIGVFSMPFLSGDFKGPRNPLSHKKVTEFDSYITKVFTWENSSQEEDEDEAFTFDTLLSNIQNFVDTPEGGTSWRVFGETGQTPYTYDDEEGEQWSGVRPEFSNDLKKLDGTEILIQGYMFPLGQEEKQPLFLLGPFPLSCPYHYHVTPNLIIEAHAKKPVTFSYDAVNVKGRLELVYKDDEYNAFFRLKDVELVK